MKLIRHIKILITFFALITLASCQDEITEVTQPNEQEAILPNTPLANRVFSMSTFNGSVDQIVTNTSCLAIQLPFTVIVNSNEIIIETQEDYDIVATIFDEFDDDDDDLQIVFPVTLILFDYSEVVVNSNSELEFYIDECENTFDFDDDIDCIDFQYPITLSLFNTAFQFLDTVVVNNDQELFNFLDDDFDDVDLLVSINYPINLMLVNGTIITVNSNQELEAAIDANDDDCDDDNTTTTDEELEALLINCLWKVDDLEINDEDLDELFEDYLIDFQELGVVVVTNLQSEVFIGTWSIVETTTSVKLNLEITGLPELNNPSWVLRDVEDDDDDDELEVKFRNLEDELELEQVCISTDNEQVQNLESIITDGSWEITQFINDEDDDTANFQNYSFVFGLDGTVEVTDNLSNNQTGTWFAFLNSQNQLKLIFNFSDDIDPINELDDDWDVELIIENRMELLDDENQVIFEKL